jgi:DNA-binding CsgD family transcriptional regulator
MPRASKAYSFKPFWVCILLAPAFILLLGIPAVGTIIFAEDLDGIFYIIFAGMITVILAVDFCAFYLYSKLAVHYEARVMADEVASFPKSAPPPVWTPEQGLAQKFIEKYQLTPREKEVAELVLKGRSNSEIAMLLDITVNTTEVHLRHIYEKTGSQGRYALIALCNYDALGKHKYK